MHDADFYGLAGATEDFRFKQLANITVLNIEQILTNRYPQPLNQPTCLFSRPLLGAFRLLFHGREINQFLATHQNLQGFAFLEQVLEHFSFGYAEPSREKQNIPASGRVVIVANHPLGALDALALIQLISEIRLDVKVVVNELLANLKPLKNLFFSSGQPG